MKTPTAVLGATAAACLAAGCSSATHAEPKPARPVTVQTVASATRQPGVRYSARIEPYEQVALAFKTAGYIDTLTRRTGPDGRQHAAQPGDVVSKGTILAKVRDVDAQERLNQGRARLAEGEAALAKARLDLDRARVLFASESLTKPDLDAAQAGFDISHARVAAARAEVELARIALGDTTLIAPARGVLLERRVEVGSLVGPGTVGFVLGDISSVKARFGIPDERIPAVTLGERIDVGVDTAASSRFEGTVTMISPAADPQSRVFDVEVTIPNPDGRLRPGMIGTVMLRADSETPADAASAVAVPLTSIIKVENGANQYGVFIADRQGPTDVARLRPVGLGDVRGNDVVILTGLRAGERVVVTGAALLVDGEPIRVISGRN